MNAERADAAQTTHTKLLPIQYLRAVAALMVVWHHAAEQLPGLKPLINPVYGAYGVDLFFVISGFVMVLTTHGRAVSRRAFLWRRIVRIVPLYWLLTSLLLALLALRPGWFGHAPPDLAHVVASFLFVPHESARFPGELWPVLVPGWTLNYEMFFYACFALLLGRPWMLCGLFGGLVLLGSIAPETALGPVVRFYTSYHLLEFVAGILAALAWIRHGRPLPRWARWRFDLWQQLGDASYAIYLSHAFSLGLLRLLWKPLWTPGDPWSAGAFMVCALVFSAAVGCLMFRFVERPLLARLNT